MRIYTEDQVAAVMGGVPLPPADDYMKRHKYWSAFEKRVGQLYGDTARAELEFIPNQSAALRDYYAYFKERTALTMAGLPPTKYMVGGKEVTQEDI